MSPERHTRVLWLVALAAAAILMITMGIRMSIGLFVQPLLNTTALSMTAISFAMAVTQLMWGVAQPISGALADRFGAKPVLFWGTLLLALGCILMPIMPSEIGLTLTLGIFLAFGAGAGSHSILMSLVANRVPAKMRGSASGIVNAGGSFGQFLFAPLVQSLIFIPAIGWQGAMYSLSVISLLILPLVFWLNKNETNTTHAINYPTSDGISLKTSITIAFHNHSYILLHLSFFTCGFHIAFLVTHLPTEISLCGLPPKVASLSLAIIGIANVVGSLIIGWCVGYWRSKYILFWMYSSRAFLIWTYLFIPKTDLNFYLFSAGLGLTWLATVPPTATIVGKLFGTRYLATLFGLTLLSHQIGGFLGAWLGGWTMTRFGDYGWMWYADMALATIAALLNLPIKENK